MPLLLDTHTLLWCLMAPQRLTHSTLTELKNRNNQVLVSSAVIWEIAIKRAMGKLQAPSDLLDVVQKSGFSFLPILENHALATERLPMIHKDPFDRMLIAQAIVENATIVTRDANIPLYGVPCILPSDIDLPLLLGCEKPVHGNAIPSSPYPSPRITREKRPSKD